MPKALPITRDDHMAGELREAATRSNDADATRRMLALALVLETGHWPFPKAAGAICSS